MMQNLPVFSWEDLISLYNLQPHPEGGFFKETYRDARIIPAHSLPEGFSGERNFSTAIYFLIPAGNKSSLHRIKSDEVWHFYLGDSLVLVQISPQGDVKKTILGQNVKNDQVVQHVVPAGDWFGAYPNLNSEFSFVGCTVAPGFNFSDFELGKKDELLKLFPNAREEIDLLTNS
jgi:predicted cupin superfamily sugar epimerase